MAFSSLFAPDRVINFVSDMKIELYYKNSVAYKSTSKYDLKLMTKNSWHQITVDHKGRFNKNEILLAIFDTVKGEEFFPVAYEVGSVRDCFLVRKCKPALDLLFKEGLMIRGPQKFIISLTIRLNVAQCKDDHISPYVKIARAINERFKQKEKINYEYDIMNLSNFKKHKEFRDLEINLGNRGVLEQVCKTMINNEREFRQINGLILSDNDITTLSPLSIFNGCEFEILDLRNNDIRSPARTCAELKNIKIKELLLAGNPITRTENYPHSMQSIIDKIAKLDGVCVQNLSKNYTPIGYEVDITCDGVRIDDTNRSKMVNYEQYSDWHAFVVYDQEEAYSKDVIFDAFFDAVSPTLSEVYPCYYKFSSGEHQFLLRNCFDQLKYIVDKCNFKLIIRPKNPTFENMFFDEDEQDQVTFYLRLCVDSIKPGQIDPSDAVNKAIESRYNPMDRILNLDNFSSAKGLENIVVNLANEKILKSVIQHASRKYMSNVVELRLGKNKIISPNFPQALAYMTNLKVLDLSYNEIKTIDDIKSLEKIGIKSLILDGNPLCRNYAFAHEYILDVKILFPGLTMLDNKNVAQKGISLNSHKNFVCEIEAYDLVEQFITSYFNMHHTLGARHLKEYYHSKAILSFSSQFGDEQYYLNNLRRIERYKELSRNILKMKDLTRAHTSLFLGQDEIAFTLSNLPKIEFDLQSFKTDAIFHDKNVTVLTINGVFRDLARNVEEADLTIAFTRTFVLVPVRRNIGTLKGSTEYKIRNDQFSIYNATRSQKKMAFMHTKRDDSKKKEQMTTDDKENLLIMFQELTKLKSIWCTRFIDEGKGDFRAALQAFVKHCKQNNVPDTAFI